MLLAFAIAYLIVGVVMTVGYVLDDMEFFKNYFVSVASFLAMTCALIVGVLAWPWFMHQRYKTMKFENY